MKLLRAIRNHVGGGLMWLRRRFRRSPLKLIKHGVAALSYIAEHSSRSVVDVSSKLGLPLANTVAVMNKLEQAGLVRISRDAIASNRIVAITKKGRQELAR